MYSAPFLRMALVLGLLSAIGPFAIDMYLPALPAIGQSLGAEMSQVQASLTAFFLALGAGQLLYGPLADRLGRKTPLYAGMGLFLAASLGCALAQDANTLVALRFVQGLGAAAGMAIPRAIVRDLHTGTEAARLMSLLMLVFSVSPILAPLAGSALIALAGWRAVFWAVSLAALAGLAMIAFFLPETRPAAERRGTSLGGVLRDYAGLLGDRQYLALVLIGSFSLGGFFVYLANSPFVLIGHYGLSPTQYSLAFALNAISFIGASQFVGRLGERLGLARLMHLAILGACATLLLLLACFAAGLDRLELLIALYLVASAFMGLVIPTSSVLALDNHGERAGTASALLGTLQMLMGALMMGVAGLFGTGQPLPMVVGMVLGPLLALGLSLASRRAAATQHAVSQAGAD
jgi:DHA1 family bicyclomycin/chloramphenicol resistance-like MFS transporter